MTHKVLLLLLSVFMIGTTASAGIMELGTSVSYRSSHIDANNYQTSFSTTASISYYFWEMSALELSYTNGVSKVHIKQGTDPAYTILTGFDMLGVDFVLTFAKRESTFQPYIKVGGAKMDKEIYREVEGNAKTKIGGTSGVVPSAGLGFKMKLTKSFSLKLSADAWISDDEEISDINSDNLDYATRAGISWFF